MKRWLLMGAVVGVLHLADTWTAQATTWTPGKFVCPVCGTENRLSVVMSYGGYIYGWPSKYQYVFWPFIDPHVLYACRNCGLTAFMGDFEAVPKQKADEIRKSLAGAAYRFADGDYMKVPMSERLAVAEKVYRVLGKDDDFWCKFHRILGYHLDEQAKQQADAAARQALQSAAAEARKKALSLAEKMLKAPENEPVRKELLFISGAMRHFLKDNVGALTDFKAAKPLTYKGTHVELARLRKAGPPANPQAAAEFKIQLAEMDAAQEPRDKGLDKYFSELLDDYVKLIESGRKAWETPEK